MVAFNFDPTKPIALVGGMCSGKTTIAKKFEQDGYNRIRTYTTRPPRPGESSDDYFFVSNEEFFSMMTNGLFMETDDYKVASGDTWYYGSLRSDYKIPNSVIILTPMAIYKLRNELNVVFVDPPFDTRLDRAHHRGDDPKEVTRRFTAEDTTFRLFREYPQNYDLRLTGGLSSAT